MRVSDKVRAGPCGSGRAREWNLALTIILGPRGKHSLRALVHLRTSPNASSDRQLTALQCVSVPCTPY